MKIVPLSSLALQSRWQQRLDHKNCPERGRESFLAYNSTFALLFLTSFRFRFPSRFSLLRPATKVPTPLPIPPPVSDTHPVRQALLSMAERTSADLFVCVM
jgi:hypothetical protein